MLPASQAEQQAAEAVKDTAKPLVDDLTDTAKQSAGNLQDAARQALEEVNHGQGGDVPAGVADVLWVLPDLLRAQSDHRVDIRCGAFGLVRGGQGGDSHGGILLLLVRGIGFGGPVAELSRGAMGWWNCG